MHVVFIVLLFSMIGAQESTRLPATGDYDQTYSIFIKGTFAGTERVLEKADAQGNLVASSEHEILITDGLETKRMAFETRMVLAKSGLAPLNYALRYTSGESHDSYDVTVKGTEARRVLVRGGSTTEVTRTLDPGAVILDFSVYHQYDYVARKYDYRKAGRQSFPNFIPLIGGELPLAMTFLNESTMPSAKGNVAVRNLKIEFAGLWTGTLAVDRDNRLVRLTIPVQDLEVIRGDLVAKP